LDKSECEPEVWTLPIFSARWGANIAGAGSPTITVHRRGKVVQWRGHEVIPDRIEAATF